MSEYFEIAYAIAAERLCLFTGTGFSKAITKNKAPGWQKLLEDCCDLLNDDKKIKAELFPIDGKNLLSLEESAQIIDIELNKIGKNIHNEIATLIGKVKLAGDNAVVEKFIQSHPLKVITTNYDKLMEAFAKDGSAHSIALGMPIPRSTVSLDVYHIHGSIDLPQHMVVTSDDYFRFINTSSYHAKKLSTVLHENTVVFLGYSLGDANLKSILSDYRDFSRSQAAGGNIFFISKNPVSQLVKDYYSHCYGIRVLDNTEIHEFFTHVNEKTEIAKKRFEKSLTNLNNVLNANATFKDDFLRLEDSFFEILSSVHALGKSINDPNVITMLGKIITQKMGFTGEDSAWEQYVHLAKWLVHLGSRANLDGTDIREQYLKAVSHSMTSMSKRLVFGRSWHAYNAWNMGWLDMTPKNRIMIKKYILEHASHELDALHVINRG